MKGPAKVGTGRSGRIIGSCLVASALGLGDDRAGRITVPGTVVADCANRILAFSVTVAPLIGRLRGGPFTVTLLLVSPRLLGRGRRISCVGGRLAGVVTLEYAFAGIMNKGPGAEYMRGTSCTPGRRRRGVVRRGADHACQPDCGNTYQ